MMRSSFRLSHLTAFAAALPFLLAGIARGGEAASTEGITVSYRLDPRVADPTHGGNRWISPPTYLGANAQDTVEALAQGVDAKGNPARIYPKWIASDQGMVSVSPNLGNQVKIVVKRAGESKLKVVAGSVSTELVVQARTTGRFVQVTITQPQARNTAAAASAQAPREQPALKGTTDKEAQDAREKLLQKRDQEKLAVQQRKQHAEKSAKQLGNRPGVVTLATGLRYKEIRKGHGRKPTSGEKAKCRIRVIDIDGKASHSAEGDGQIVAFDVAGDRGLGEALRLMRVGSKWQVFMPSRVTSREVKRRGRRRSGLGAAYSVPVVYEVELLAIESLASADQKTSASALLQPMNGN
jgi:FKBP-type peptidyl-prolyl cis-trans isomerase FklB